MTDEAEKGDIGETKKSSRWKSAIKRTKTKLRKQDDSEKEEFKLSDDVNDFLQAGRPSTSDSFSNSERSATPPDKLFYPETDHSQMSRAGLTRPFPPTNRTNTPPQPTTTPQKSPRGIPVPRLDVSNSQRWPRQQELGLQDIDDFLHPRSQQQQSGPQPNPRSQSQGPVQRKKKNRPRNLSVTFLDAPPIIIGEGGDESETPPKEISRAWGRARSISPMPTRMGDEPQYVGKRRQEPAQQTRGEPNHIAHQEFEPRPLGRAGTGFPVPGTSMKSPENAEFDMILQPPTPQSAVLDTPYSDPSEHPRRGPSPNFGSPARPLAHPHPPSQFYAHNQSPNPKSHPPSAASASRVHSRPSNHHSSDPEQLNHHSKHSLEPEPPFKPNRRSPRPAVASQDLRMQFEEGQALRHSHYRDLSNTSSIDDESSPPAFDTTTTGGTGFSPLGDDPDIRRLSLGNTAEAPADPDRSRGKRIGAGDKYGNVREMTRRIKDPEGEENLGGWI